MEVIVNHFSIYGLFGDVKQTSQPNSGSGGGSGGGSNSKEKPVAINQSENIKTQDLEENLVNKTMNQEELKQNVNTPLTGEVISDNNGKLTSNIPIIIILIIIIGLGSYLYLKKRKNA